MKFNLYSDPGHAWCKVPIELLMELGIHIHISKYSYKLGQHAYLEEDRDLSVFMDAMKKSGKSVTFHEHRPTKNDSRIRKYDSYSVFMDQFDEDFHYNVPLEELDRVELSKCRGFFEVHTKGGIHERPFWDKKIHIGPSISRFKSTKTVSYKPPYLVIK